MCFVVENEKSYIEWNEREARKVHLVSLFRFRFLSQIAFAFSPINRANMSLLT